MLRSAALLPLLLLAGCTESVLAPGDETGQTAAALPKIGFIVWEGHITHAALDPLAHMRDPETVLWPIQQAGFLVEIPDVPQAIEVMVSWDDPDAGFRLHPHYQAENDPSLGGDTLYYGYLSEMFTTSPGCVRIPATDMAAGIWPMMIHPMQGTMDVDYAITVFVIGSDVRVLPDMHGHRSDGDAPVEDHGIEPCSLLTA